MPSSPLIRSTGSSRRRRLGGEIRVHLQLRRGIALRRSSPLDASTSSGRDVHVEDIDAALSVDGPESRRALELKLSDIPAYDAAPCGARRRRGDQGRAARCG